MGLDIGTLYAGDFSLNGQFSQYDHGSTVNFFEPVEDVG